MSRNPILAKKSFMISRLAIEKSVSTTPSLTLRATFPVKPSLTMMSALPE